MNKVQKLNEENDDLKRALKVAEEHSILSVNKAQMITVNMEKNKIIDGKFILIL